MWLALEDDHLGVMHEAVDHRGDRDRVPKISAHAENALFELTTSERRS